MRLILVIGLLLLPVKTAAGDACEALLPNPLRASLEKTFPAYRSPLATDNLPEDIEWQVQHGGPGCLGGASADFNGDSQLDWVIGLSARQGAGGAVVVALRRGRDWSFHVLATLPDGRVRLYVASDKPGLYRRTEAVSGALESGEVDSLRCQHAVVVFGATESSGVAYCLARGRWQHVWISD